LASDAWTLAGITGFSQYDKLYADVETWLANGWLDYLAPQLYWPIQQTPQAFKVLLDYWQRQNVQQRPSGPDFSRAKLIRAKNPGHRMKS
jgi:uncharacterized lipoprotein YddW (UPF0748 family)